MRREHGAAAARALTNDSRERRNVLLFAVGFDLCPAVFDVALRASLSDGPGDSFLLQSATFQGFSDDVGKQLFWTLVPVLAFSDDKNLQLCRKGSASPSGPT